MEPDRSNIEKNRIIKEIRDYLSENGIDRKQVSGAPGLSNEPPMRSRAS
jgi:hypothetical protein